MGIERMLTVSALPDSFQRGSLFELIHQEPGEPQTTPTTFSQASACAIYTLRFRFSSIDCYSDCTSCKVGLHLGETEALFHFFRLIFFSQSSQSEPTPTIFQIVMVGL
ncbi:hypothetical protein WK69_01615 [Burkholderia ubonensis]|nr:hypothetical protein WK69_01615 [Burkholderia ubonensis]KVV28980.1 hypothetical protein WK79_07685 [Burkholderia ubonensis]